jgi:hypothetical protein
MSPRKNPIIVAAAVASVLLASLWIAACQSSVPSGSSSTANPVTTAASSTTIGSSTTGGSQSPSTSVSSTAPDVSLGRTIYVDGTDASGNLIPRSGGIGMMGGSGCITCHGPDGKGGTIDLMMSQFDVPDIRWSTLSKPMQSPEGDMEPPYDSTTFARAVREGIGSDGGSLEAPMPQWQLTDQQVNALIAYLMTL